MPVVASPLVRDDVEEIGRLVTYLRSIAAEYACFVAAGVLGIVMAAWLVVGF